MDGKQDFLFLGNRLSLDFLNTRPTLEGSPKELLPGCAALSRWLGAAGLISAEKAKRLEKSWSGRSEHEEAANELREFRERLRRAVFQMEAGLKPGRVFVEEVNRELATHPYLDEVIESECALVRGKRFDPRTPREVFAPLVDDVASLLVLPDKSRLRMCRTCVLHFLDTSKKGTRVWCSMSLCGNRSKVAAYSRR